MSDDRKIVVAAVEWRQAPAFAEVAEVLGVATTQVMAVMDPEGGRCLALFSPTYVTAEEPVPDDAPLYRVFLARDRDGVLQLDSTAVEVPGLWRKIREHIERGQP